MSQQDYQEPIPQDVWDFWIANCRCCFMCGQSVPCGGVMAGGLCDDICECDEREEDRSCYYCGEESCDCDML